MTWEHTVKRHESTNKVRDVIKLNRRLHISIQFLVFVELQFSLQHQSFGKLL